MSGNLSSTTNEPSGRKVIFWLFAGLWIMTAAVLVYFASITEPDYRRRIYVALVVNLMLPLIAWQAFRLIEQRRHA
jgi:uncharacterized membrane protein YhaH (DUF805 family)